MKHPRFHLLTTIGALFCALTACQPESGESTAESLTGAASGFEWTGVVSNPELDEISGIETAVDGRFFVHNDEGAPVIHVIERDGRYLQEVKLDDARNRDWEDITLIPRDGERWVVGGDIGDNNARYKTIRLYFFREPVADENGVYPAEVQVEHAIKLRYPDGPRDSEAMAYDASSDTILLITKRDRVPRVYGISLETALREESAELQFLGEVPTLTPPSAEEMLRGGKKALWLSQPTGMDISADGLLAAVLTYRSLYLFTREPEESWVQAFNRKPQEFYGPPGIYEEAVTIDGDTGEVYITTEKVPTPVYRMKIPD